MLTCTTTAAAALLLLSSSFPLVVDSFTAVPVPSSTSVSMRKMMSNPHSHLSSLHAAQSNHDDNKDNKKSPMQVLGTALLSTMLFWNTIGGGGAVSPTPTLTTPPVANAAEGAKIVGALKGSGLVFKDTLQIERFNDPKVQGVVLYISNFERPITEKLSGKNFFNDPSSAGVACAKIGKISIADNIAKGPGGEEVFEESKSLLFKTLRVQRIYDEETQTVVYVSFSTRLDKSDDSNMARFKSALCAVHLD